MTYEQLETKLIKDLLWRKKEFTELAFMLQGNNSTFRKEIVLKASISLLYSHWEGHIKYCAQKYIEYINGQKIICEELKENFKQIFLGSCFSNAEHNFREIKTQKKLYEFFAKNNSKFKVNEKETIKTNSNLKYENIEIILMQLGFPENLYKNNKDFIDTQLLAARNAICHGDQDRLYNHNFENVYDQTKSRLLNMIELFHEQVLFYAKNKLFLKKNITK